MLANIDENGQDGGNLRLNTNKLEYSDINDYSNSNESGWGIQTNLPINTSGGQGALDSAKDSILHPSGSTTITQKDVGTEKEQETRATIGEGSINIEGKAATEEQTDGLNRDTENTQEITKDQVTGATDYNITADHEVAEKVGILLKETGNKITKEVIDIIKDLTSKEIVETISLGARASTADNQFNAKEHNSVALIKIQDEINIENKQIEENNEYWLSMGYTKDELLKSGKWKAPIVAFTEMTDTQKDAYIDSKLKEYNQLSDNISAGDQGKNQGRLYSLEKMIPLEYLIGEQNKKTVIAVNNILSKDPEYFSLSEKIDSNIATEQDMLKFADKVIKANLAIKKEKISYELHSDYYNGLGSYENTVPTIGINTRDSTMRSDSNKIRSIAFHEADHLLRDKAAALNLLDKVLKRSNENMPAIYYQQDNSSSLFEQSAYMMQEYSYTNPPRRSRKE